MTPPSVPFERMTGKEEKMDIYELIQDGSKPCSEVTQPHG